MSTESDQQTGEALRESPADEDTGLRHRSPQKNAPSAGVYSSQKTNEVMGEPANIEWAIPTAFGAIELGRLYCLAARFRVNVMKFIDFITLIHVQKNGGAKQKNLRINGKAGD